MFERYLEYLLEHKLKERLGRREKYKNKANTNNNKIVFFI